MKISFHHADCLNLEICDWTRGEIVYASSTCFDEKLMQNLGNLAEKMKPGIKKFRTNIYTSLSYFFFT